MNSVKARIQLRPQISDDSDKRHQVCRANKHVPPSPRLAVHNPHRLQYICTNSTTCTEQPPQAHRGACTIPHGRGRLQHSTNCSNTKCSSRSASTAQYSVSTTSCVSGRSCTSQDGTRRAIPPLTWDATAQQLHARNLMYATSCTQPQAAPRDPHVLSPGSSCASSARRFASTQKQSGKGSAEHKG